MNIGDVIAVKHTPHPHVGVVVLVERGRALIGYGTSQFYEGELSIAVEPFTRFGKALDLDRKTYFYGRYVYSPPQQIGAWKSAKRCSPDLRDRIHERIRKAMAEKQRQKRAASEQSKARQRSEGRKHIIATSKPNKK